MRDITVWWKKPSFEGRQGRIATVRGSDERIACPKCGQYPVVYNGNYFCDNHGSNAGDCDWALAHPARTEHDKAVCILIGIDFA
jgi:hypothetical protein